MCGPISKTSTQCTWSLEAHKVQKLPGNVWGSHIYVSVFPGVLELKSVKPGHIVIKGKSTSLFLCVDSGGHLRGQVQKRENSVHNLGPSCPSLTVYICCPFQRHYIEADCTFRELLLADGYTRFLSSHHGSAVSLASKQAPDRQAVPFTRFLPLRNTLAEESVSERPPNNQRYFNMDSDDLLGMGLNTMISPQFSVDM